MKKEIKVESYVRMNGQTIPIENLTPDQRETFAVWLKETYLNELFRGQGRVTVKEDFIV